MTQHHVLHVAQQLATAAEHGADDVVVVIDNRHKVGRISPCLSFAVWGQQYRHVPTGF
jgi:hypothetical protein